MNSKTLFKSLAIVVPLAMAGCAKPTENLASKVACNVGGSGAFKVTMSIDKGDDGNPVISFTNYTLEVGTDGNPANPLIFICVGGQATFEGVPEDERVTFKDDPNGVFSQSNRANPKVSHFYILNNKNNEEKTFHYSITVNTTDFGKLTIDPRVKDGGGGITS